MEYRQVRISCIDIQSITDSHTLGYELADPTGYRFAPRPGGQTSGCLSSRHLSRSIRRDYLGAGPAGLKRSVSSATRGPAAATVRNASSPSWPAARHCTRCWRREGVLMGPDAGGPGLNPVTGIAHWR